MSAQVQRTPETRSSRSVVASHSPRTFATVLFADQEVREEVLAQPDCFHDLHLDQIVAAVLSGRDGYQLSPIFNQALGNAADILFRQDVCRDLQDGELYAIITTFAGAMHRVRELLSRAEKQRRRLQKQARILEAAIVYCDGLGSLSASLATIALKSAGLSAWRDYLAAHIVSPAFVAIRQTAKQMAEDLAAVRFTVRIEGLRVRIDPFNQEPDYGARIFDSYGRFSQGGEEGFRFRHPEADDLNSVEERILDQVARAFPGPFGALAAFAANPGPHFRDDRIVRFDREIQFYVAYLEHIRRLQDAGLSFCFPEVTPAKDVFADESFDLALAQTVPADGLVPNSFRLQGRERILVISGPNQGGKTTFARMFGQLHYLACLGLPVPGRSARLHIFDAILTHFERPEIASSPHGKLEDELVRLHGLLQEAGSESIVILNELFASTTFRDAYALSAKIGAVLASRGLLCVWVSFIDGLSDLSDTMVSMVAEISPQDATQRTFRLERRRADGLAYARSIARKYGLMPQEIEERLRR